MDQNSKIIINKIKRSLVNLLKKYGRENNLTDTQLAELLGINQTRISVIFRTNKAKIDTLLNYVTILGMDVSLKTKNKSTKIQVRL